MAGFRDKIIPLSGLPSWRRELQATGKRLVVTNGCFDLLHLGHITYLEHARGLGDMLLVGVNGDASVRALKGEGRPLNSEQDRVALIASLMMVDVACVFPEVTALRFLGLAQPHIYVKGGDYRMETLQSEERKAIEAQGGQIVILPLVPGKSTTELTNRLAVN